MNNKEKGNLTGLLGALLVHVAAVALLLWITVDAPVIEEGGLAVAMGMEESAQGNDDPEGLVDVDVLEETTAPDVPEPVKDVPELITQEDEPTVAIPEKKKPVKKEPTKKVEKKKEPVKHPEKTAEEKKAEAKRKAAEEAERKRKAAAEAANSKIKGAFGKGKGMNKGTADAGKGIQGSKEGNAAEGVLKGEGYGNDVFGYSLDGRRHKGSFPLPDCKLTQSGKIVVHVVVNPSGKVIHAVAGQGSNIQDLTLRKAAEDAAREATFESVDRIDNQRGTITYKFKLK